jgi:hypothetical protein
MFELSALLEPLRVVASCETFMRTVLIAKEKLRVSAFRQASLTGARQTGHG